MKGLKTFYLDIEILQELKKVKNPSNLINSYLKNYFGTTDGDKEVLRQKAEESRELAAAFETQADSMQEAEPRIIQIREDS